MRDAGAVLPDLPTDDLPLNVDWRERGAVTAVKNQGFCGSCWTFATTGTVESANAIAGNELISLAEQQLVDCVTADDGCNGGCWNSGGVTGDVCNGGCWNSGGVTGDGCNGGCWNCSAGGGGNGCWKCSGSGGGSGFCGELKSGYVIARTGLGAYDCGGVDFEGAGGSFAIGMGDGVKNSSAACLI